MPGRLRVIATNNVAIFRHLAAPALTRLGVTCEVVADHDALLAAVAAAPPAVALIDVELAGGNGYDACRTIKHAAASRATRVALILPPRGLVAIDRTVIDRLAESGCDDVIAPPLTADDFYAHLAQLTSLPLRRDRRIAVELEVELPSGEAARSVAGQVTNVGAGGVGLRLDQPLIAGTQIAARFRVSDLVSPATSAVVAWCRPADPLEGGHAAGLMWNGDVPLRTRLLLEQVALFDLVDERDSGGTGLTVSLHGDFTEMTRFESLAVQLTGATDVTFDLSAVRYISSAGVRAWCELLGGIAGVRKRYRHCSIAFASQASMVPLVLGDGEVVSLEAPYYCEPCGRDEVRLLEVGAIARDGDRLLAPRLTCGACGAPTELDDIAERYFAFLS